MSNAHIEWKCVQCGRRFEALMAANTCPYCGKSGTVTTTENGGTSE